MSVGKDHVKNVLNRIHIEACSGRRCQSCDLYRIQNSFELDHCSDMYAVKEFFEPFFETCKKMLEEKGKWPLVNSAEALSPRRHSYGECAADVFPQALRLCEVSNEVSCDLCWSQGVF